MNNLFTKFEFRKKYLNIKIKDILEDKSTFYLHEQLEENSVINEKV